MKPDYLSVCVLKSKLSVSRVHENIITNKIIKSTETSKIRIESSLSGSNNIKSFCLLIYILSEQIYRANCLLLMRCEVPEKEISEK